MIDSAALRNKVLWRLMPLLSLLYLLNIMDRTNVGYARDQMEADLAMDPRVFSWGFGMFYVGYLMFEVPANLILQRVGARRWIARIVVSWGLISCATAAVTGPTSFYLVRILLGIAEAGFFPGIVLYLTYWFPTRERGKALALFMTGMAISGVVANPISGAIMQHMPGVGGLKGWQWLFILEGLPSVLAGFFVFGYLPDGPGDAPWLNDAERASLAERLRQEDQYRRQHHGSGELLRGLRDWRLWMLTFIYVGVAIAPNAGSASFPKMIKFRFAEFAESQKGLLVALPALCALIAMVVMGRLSDRTGWRRGIFALTGLMAALGWGLVITSGQPWPLPVLGEAGSAGGSDLVQSRWLFLIGMCLAQAGMISMIPTFWVLPTTFLSGTAAAAGIALINSVGNIGGIFAAPVHDQFGHPIMIFMALAAITLVFVVRHDSTLDQESVPPTASSDS